MGRFHDLDPGSLALLRAARDDLLRAVKAYNPARGATAAVCSLTLDVDSAARRGRIQSGNAARDVALLLLLVTTGARPLEIARLRVSDYLDAEGQARDACALDRNSGRRRGPH